MSSLNVRTTYPIYCVTFKMPFS